MGTIKELIDEYAEITGRPVASISVEEYIKLKKYIQEDTIIFPLNKDMSLKNDEKQFVLEESQNIENETGNKIRTHKAPVSSAFMMMRSISG